MKRYYFDTDMRGDPKPVECAEGGLVYFEEANARIAELTAEVASLRNALISITHEVRFSVDPITDHIATIARNALKEVV